VKYRACAVPGCPTLTASSRCDLHAKDERGSSAARGYGSKHRRLFRSAVLARAGYLCVLRLPGCSDIATVADHFPLSRRELVEAGMNPNDPGHGRALCASCHNKETARNQPGGWNAR
jgi:5-methylcytosine-specific restriction enzyme A